MVCVKPVHTSPPLHRTLWGFGRKFSAKCESSYNNDPNTLIDPEAASFSVSLDAETLAMTTLYACSPSGILTCLTVEHEG